MKTPLRLLLSEPSIITHKLYGKQACMFKHKVCPGRNYYVVTFKNTSSCIVALIHEEGRLNNNPCKKIFGNTIWVYKTYGRAKDRFWELETSN